MNSSGVTELICDNIGLEGEYKKVLDNSIKSLVGQIIYQDRPDLITSAPLFFGRLLKAMSEKNIKVDALDAPDNTGTIRIGKTIFDSETAVVIGEFAIMDSLIESAITDILSGHQNNGFDIWTVSLHIEENTFQTVIRCRFKN
jgi:hypothetical protein